MIKEKSNNVAERRITQLKRVNFHRKKITKKSVKLRKEKISTNEKKALNFFSRHSLGNN